VGDEAGDVLKAREVGSVVLLNGRYIHTTDGLFLDSTALAKRIAERIPDTKSRDIVVLDWEGQRMNQIVEGARDQTPTYREAKEQLLSAYRLVKGIRPNVTVGFYGFPARDYWNRNDDWRARNQALAPFLSEVDAIFPSLYDFYHTTPKNREMEIGYVQDNVSEALLLGAQLGKPVMPFVWHRYHDSNKELGRALIPPDEFAEHLRTIVKTKVKNRRVDGVVWWSSERYFYNISKGREGSTADFDQLNSPITKIYLKTLLQAMADE
jgi:hypothetical protein